MTTRVTFASDWTSSAGKTYKRGETAEIDAADARSLIFRGRVRAATEPAEAAEPPTDLVADGPAELGEPAPALVDAPAENTPIPDAARRRPRADTGTATAVAAPAKPSETKEA